MAGRSGGSALFLPKQRYLFPGPSRCFPSIVPLICLHLLQRFDELLQLASKGQHTNVDMLVKDIYGGSYGCLGLTGDLIASSFGKSATADKGKTRKVPENMEETVEFRSQKSPSVSAAEFRPLVQFSCLLNTGVEFSW